MPATSRPVVAVLVTAAVAAGLVSAGCRRAPDPVEELLELQRIEREAHLAYDAGLLARHLADTVVTLRDGEVHRQARDEVTGQLASYFDAVTFLEWSDLEPPAVEVAASGDLATVRLRRRVRLGRVDSAGTTRLEHTVFAWWETWRRGDGRWRLAAIATTDRPGTAEVADRERRAVPGPADRSPAEILARASAHVVRDRGALLDTLRGLAYTARAHAPGGPFRTTLRSDPDGSLALRQRTSQGADVRLSVGRLVEQEADSVVARRAFLQGHALLDFALRPTAVLGRPRRSGRITFAGESADLVEFEDAAGRPLDLLYRRSSGRLLGARIRTSGDPAETVLIYLSGWTRATGLVLPHRAAFLQGDELFLYRMVALGPAPGTSLALPPPSRLSPTRPLP